MYKSVIFAVLSFYFPTVASAASHDASPSEQKQDAHQGEHKQDVAAVTPGEQQKNKKAKHVTWAEDVKDNKENLPSAEDTQKLLALVRAYEEVDEDLFKARQKADTMIPNPADFSDVAAYQTASSKAEKEAEDSIKPHLDQLDAAFQAMDAEIAHQKEHYGYKNYGRTPAGGFYWVTPYEKKIHLPGYP